MGKTKTSKEWFELIQEFHSISITILDYDGWDRNNFEYSFNEELITSEEFERRLALCTVSRIQSTR